MPRNTAKDGAGSELTVSLLFLFSLEFSFQENNKSKSMFIVLNFN